MGTTPQQVENIVVDPASDRRDYIDRSAQGGSPLAQYQTPFVGGDQPSQAWFTTATVSGVSADVMPWMLAQGWAIASYSVDKTVYPWVYTYVMQRTVSNNHNILFALLRDLTAAYNEGRQANEDRYVYILRNWNDILQKQQDEVAQYDQEKLHGDGATTGHVTLLLASLTDLDSAYTSFATDVDQYAREQNPDAALTALRDKWESAASDLETDYTNQVGSSSDLSLSTILADVTDAIGQFEAAVSAFQDAYGTLGSTLASDYSTHAGLARGFLTGLGTTELVRINEAFDARLATVRQNLAARGLYSSGLLNSAEERVERERSEAITALNDKLARERLDNQHKLYEQQVSMRLGGLEAAIKIVDATAKVATDRMRVGEWNAEIRHKFLGLSVQTRLAILGVREKRYKTLLEAIDWKTARRDDLYKKLVETKLKQVELRTRVAGMEMELLKYQLDERNKLAIGMFGVMERRSDTYPDLTKMAEISSALGEGGFVSP